MAKTTDDIFEEIWGVLPQRKSGGPNFFGSGGKLDPDNAKNVSRKLERHYRAGDLPPAEYDLEIIRMAHASGKKINPTDLIWFRNEKRLAA